MATNTTVPCDPVGQIAKLEPGQCSDPTCRKQRVTVAARLTRAGQAIEYALGRGFSSAAARNAVALSEGAKRVVL